MDQAPGDPIDPMESSLTRPPLPGSFGGTIDGFYQGWVSHVARIWSAQDH